MKKKLFGLITRKERWGLSARGWLCLLLAGISIGAVWVLTVQPFLAQTRRADTKILVVEGWVQHFAMKAAVMEIQSGRYEKVYVTGGPIVGSDGATNDFNTSASVGAETLAKAGVPAELLQMVPSHVAGRDRTYNSALALREWFRTNHLMVASVNVLTESAHARRTRLLFQEAFGKTTEIGIIAVQNPDYDPQHWWRYSEGVREVLGESIAYLYAEFLFHPGKTGG
ncbi:MAG TPA: ElyC/SanA/YdcF family protein [Verrucomicrobiae bacterium]|nr:ElyC/SanA/YdcF family protein [Verrucomicrobiae bacterium]